MLSLKPWPTRQPVLFFMLAAVAWLALYQALVPASEALVAWLPVDRDSHLGGALQFFFYDTPKVLMLLTAVVFVMGMINSYFTPERTRALLAGRSEGVANVLAASLGIVTPFCSCSAVPLFIGFVQAGVPLGVTFSFLISAPMVNEVALTLLFGMFGWKVAMLYLGLGLSVAIVAGGFSGDPLADTVLQCGLTVQRCSHFQAHPWQALGHAFEKTNVEFARFVLTQTHIHLHARSTQPCNALTRHQRVGVLHRHHHARHTCCHERVATRPCAPLVAARFERDISGGALRVVLLRLCISQSHDFGMCFASTLCVALTDHKTLRVDQHTTHTRVG